LLEQAKSKVGHRDRTSMKIISNISEMQKWQNDSALTVGGLMPICKHCARMIKRPIKHL
jgi:hypothetical protein